MVGVIDVASADGRNAGAGGATPSASALKFVPNGELCPAPTAAWRRCRRDVALKPSWMRWAPVRRWPVGVTADTAVKSRIAQNTERWLDHLLEVAHCFCAAVSARSFSSLRALT